MFESETANAEFRLALKVSGASSRDLISPADLRRKETVSWEAGVGVAGPLTGDPTANAGDLGLFGAYASFSSPSAPRFAGTIGPSPRGYLGASGRIHWRFLPGIPIIGGLDAFIGARSACGKRAALGATGGALSALGPVGIAGPELRPAFGPLGEVLKGPEARGPRGMFAAGGPSRGGIGGGGTRRL